MSPLPSLRGRDLTGAARRLPEDLLGSPSVLLLGFAEHQQREIDLWLEALDELAVPQLEVPVAARAQEAFAPYIEGGMVPGVPVPRHAMTVVVYTDIEELLHQLGLPGRVPAAVVLGADGDVLAVHAGAPSERAAQDVSALVLAELARAGGR